MPDFPQKVLRAALAKESWTILLEHPGDDREVLAAWKMAKGGKGQPWWLGFERSDVLTVVPISPKGFPLKRKERRLTFSEIAGDWVAFLRSLKP